MDHLFGMPIGLDPTQPKDLVTIKNDQGKTMSALSSASYSWRLTICPCGLSPLKLWKW